MTAWNDMAEKAGLAKVERLTDARRRTIKARVKESGLDEILATVARVGASNFLTGNVEGRDGRAPFRASFDWTLAPSNFAKVMEGTYDNQGVNPCPPASQHPQPPRLDPIRDGWKKEVQAGAGRDT